MSCRQHGYPWPSLATSPYHSSPPAGLQGYILCPHIVAVCKFELVVLLLHGHIYIYIYIYCNVVWHRERKVRSIPLPFCVWTNSQLLALHDLLRIQVRMKTKATRTPRPIIGWTEKGMQVTLVAQPKEIVGEEREQNDWPELLAPKWYLFIRGNLDKNLEFEDRCRRIKTLVYSQNSGWSVARKKNL